MGHPVRQFQIVTPHPDAVAAFYGALFGWTITRNDALGYRVVDTASEEGISGGIWPAPPEAPTFAQLFIEVENVAAAVARATELGATVLIEPQQLPDGDEMALLHDPQGMSFGIYRSAG